MSETSLDNMNYQFSFWYLVITYELKNISELSKQIRFWINTSNKQSWKYIYVLFKYFIHAIINFFSGCSQNFQKNGILKKNKNFEIKVGETSEEYLTKKYGPPTFENVFNKNVIYYVMHNTSYKTFEERKTDELLVYEITLDNENKVLKLKQYDKNDSFNINVNKSEDENELDMSSFWKDILNAMRRKNIEN